MAFKHENFSNAKDLSLPNSEGTYKLSTGAPVDIWRKPPKHDAFDAPILYQSIPISSFKSVRVSVSGDWKTMYDQGGLILVLPPKKSSTQKRWVKTGIEVYKEKLQMSVVATDEWADWSMQPLSPEDDAAGKTTVIMERMKNDDGSYGPVLMISMLSGNGEQKIIREVCWAFHDLDESEEMWVGMYTARPTKDDREGLVVDFTGFTIES
ncbi:hypothetical protein BGZ60DRAFT_484502 [Tricladium varicosporioides]|nr:hypothetical protein BGZ60DRAFT_484502 [Hymenoscyphus varicosporioides]